MGAGARIEVQEANGTWAVYSVIGRTEHGGTLVEVDYGPEYRG